MSENVKEIQSHSHIPTESCEFTWSIENFRLCGLQGQERLNSPKFTTGTCLLTTWCLRLYPSRNKTAEKGGRVAIYLKRTTGDSSNHYATFEISIIDSKNSKRYSIQLDHLFEKASECWGCPKFIKRVQLFGPEQSTLLPQDILTVMCELKTSRVDDYKTSDLTEFPGGEHTTGTTVIFKKPDSLISDLQHLYNSSMFSDLTLRVGDEELKVHQNILCSRSSVFNTMLNCEMKEKLMSSIEITDFDPATVKMMLYYIYCGQVESLTPEIGIQLCSAAEKYNLQDLKDICVAYLSRNLRVDNFCDVLNLGALHDEERLMTATKDFFSTNAAAIKETENWLNLSKTNPDLVIAMYEVMFSKVIM